MATGTGISGALTDGDGIGTFTAPKILKDFIADALLGAATALAAVNIVSIPTDKATASIAALAVGNAIVHALYRAILKAVST